MGKKIGKNKSQKIILLSAMAIICVFVCLNRPSISGEESIVHPFYMSSQCPFQTPEEWQRVLEKFADNKKWIETCEDATCDSEYYQYVKENIANVFENCAAFISKNRKIQQCTENMRKFLPSWLRMHDGDSYGFLTDNHSYFLNQETPDKPEGMMRVPEAIVEALPYRNAVEEAARKNGLKYLTHSSAIEGIRTYVIYSDPKNRFDQWFLLNLKDGLSTIKENQPVSVIAVQKKDADGKPLSRIKLHFRDYMVVYSNNHFELKVNESGNGKCYGCHTHGMRQLISRRTPALSARPVKGETGYLESKKFNLDNFAYRRLMEFNKKIRSYGAPDWDGKIIPENHGPVLGQNQGCMDCHDGKARSALNISTSRVQVLQKVVHELSMPPDTDLPKRLEQVEMNHLKGREYKGHAEIYSMGRMGPIGSAEETILSKAMDIHKEIARDFDDSRFPALKKWFLQVPCR